MGIIDWIRLFFKPRKVPWVCEFSAKHPDHDAHDYHKAAGGDGIPMHFVQYTCWNCGKKFYI